MRAITADYIFPISSPPIKNGVVIIDNKGIILEVGDSRLKTQDLRLKTYEGIICPGFINAHCHLELSHLKGKITPKIGMAGFIKEFLSKRNNFSKKEIQSAIEKAEKEMFASGIVAVGDISNDDSTFQTKAKSKIKFHTFIEVFDLNPEKAKQEFEKGLRLTKQFKNIPLQTHEPSHPPSHSHKPSRKGELLNPLSPITNHQLSIVPHAPYSVSEKLFSLITEYARKNGSILSIHNQESQAEKDLFENGTGKIAELFKNMGIDLGFIPKNIDRSLKYNLQNLPSENKILLVHNTYTTKEDIQWAHSQDSRLKTQDFRHYWCTCPNANLYIENKLPDYEMFISENAQMTIGTDSYASNWSLSILDELKTIATDTPHIPLNTLLTWATKNGAEFLGFDKELGTIEKGKRPGLNLIKNVDLKNLKLTEKSSVKVL